MISLALASAGRGQELVLWLRADDLSRSCADGQAVELWPDASGLGHHASGGGETRPTFLAADAGGRPAVRFSADARGQGQRLTGLRLPLRGEWRGLSVLAVGRGLQGTWFDSAPGRAGSLRQLGFLQHTGNALALDAPFPALANTTTDPQLLSFVCGMDEHYVMHLRSFADGALQGEVHDPAARYGIVLHEAQLGGNPRGDFRFNGEIRELLIYRGMLSDAQRQQSESYLRARHGLTPRDGTSAGEPFAAPQPPPQRVKPTFQPNPSGLRYWLRADDLPTRGLREGEPIDTWPAANAAEPATQAQSPHRPRLALDGQRPVARFVGQARQEPKTWHSLQLPLQGDWQEITLLAAISDSGSPALFDTAPGSAGTLRLYGFLQLAGSKLAIDYPFKTDAAPRPDRKTPLTQGLHVIALTLRRGPDGAQLLSYLHGRRVAKSAVDPQAGPLRFRKPNLGGAPGGPVAFRGDLAELLIYDRALDDATIRQLSDALAAKLDLPTFSDEQWQRHQAARSDFALQFPVIPSQQSWLGNSFAGLPDWVQSGFAHLTALPDGTAAAISVWDEPHKEIGFYRDGQCVGPHVRGGGTAITNDGQYLYASVTGLGKPHVGVRRLTPQGDEAPWPTPIRVNTTEPWRDVLGIAVDATELFFTIQGDDQVHVHDVVSGAAKRTLAIAGARRLAIDRAGRLWVALPDRVAEFDREGNPTGRQIEGLHAGDLRLDPQGRLAVADDRQRQQIVFFDISGPQVREVATLGRRGGVLAGSRPGTLHDDTLFMPIGLGFDAQGQTFVAMPGVIRAYRDDQTLAWQLHCTEFTSCGDFDPQGESVHTGWTRHDPQPDGRWTLGAYTYDPVTYPHWSRGGKQVLLRRIGGHSLRYTQASPLLVHRQLPGSDVFAPCAAYHPEEHRADASAPPMAPQNTRYLWIDHNADGQVETAEISTPPADAARTQAMYNVYVDDAGGIWQPQDRHGMRHLPLRRISEQGVPIYDFADEQLIDKPREFISIDRVMYHTASDTMVLSGRTWEHSAPSDDGYLWGLAGREAIAYADWSKPTRRVQSRMPFPARRCHIKAVTVDHDSHLLLAGDATSMVIFVYDIRDGRMLGILEPDEAKVGGTGWLDIDSGIRARSRGSTITVLCEEVYYQKQLVYRFTRP